eukprot:Partr_v1_DN25727_c1_g1_i3_m74868 putative Pyridoxal (Pyridoxine, vitamin B6) kinase
MLPPRVLSVQSHVIHGYVGNKSATFPLQLLGFEVDALNTVQFSNHTGYSTVKGTILNEQETMDVIDGLEANQLLDYKYLLSGYMGSEGALRAMKAIVERLRLVNPRLIYVMDPVLGDNGYFYVPQSLIPIYRNEMLPLATLITPNHFEAQLLTGIEMTSVENGWKAIDDLHGHGVPFIVITSIPVGDEALVLLGSNKSGERFEISFKRLDAKFTGTGDLLAALILAFFEPGSLDGLRVACEKSLSIMQAVLKKTLELRQPIAEIPGDAGLDEDARKKLSKSLKMNSAELRLISCRDIILNAPVTMKAKIVDRTNNNSASV